MLGSVGNALRVMDLLSERGEMGVSEIGRQLTLTTATAHRLVRSLAESGLVERNPDTRRYALGPKILMLADRVRSRMGLREVLLPTLQEISETSGQTVNLGVYRDGQIMYVEKLDSNELFRIEVSVGAGVPAYCTGMGKAILAYLPESEVERYLDTADLQKHTPNTHTSVPDIKAELSLVREMGFAVDHGELLYDVWCIAAPVFGDSGVPVAAISVSTLRSRFESKQDELVPLLLEKSKEASKLLEGLGKLPPRA